MRVLLLGLVVLVGGCAERVVPPAPVEEAPVGVLVEYEPGSGERVTTYSLGYQRGYRALLVQVGREVPALERYVSLEECEGSEEDIDRGYRDGYHKASEMLSCPRSF